jgi:hypothetical protein
MILNLLDKIELALTDCQNNKSTETQVTLTFAELRLIRRYEMVDNFDKDMAADNLRAGQEMLKKMNIID